MKRSPLKRRSPLRKSGESVEDALWRDARSAALERDQYECRAAGVLDVDCWGPLHVHHRLPRSRGGAHELENLVSVCAGHHQWVHDHPSEATRLGLLRSKAA